MISTSKESQTASTQRISSSTSSFPSSDILDPPNLESQSYSLHLNESSLLSFLNVHQSNNRDRYNVVSSKTKKDVSTSPPVLIENGKILYGSVFFLNICYSVSLSC